MRTVRLCIALGALAAGELACAPDYAYLPTTNASAEVGGRAASDYAVPPEAPRGDVRIASFGFTDLVPRGGEHDDHTLPSVHLRVVIANNADRPWSFDTRLQRLDLAGHGQSAPAYASADGEQPPPLVSIAPGGKRTIDLFFPLPAGEQNESRVPDFDVIWTVATGARTVTERTPFERVAIEPPPAMDDDVYGPYGYGPYWYESAYVGFDGIGVPGAYRRAPVYAHGFHAWRGGGRGGRGTRR